MKNRRSLLASDMDGTVIPLELSEETAADIAEFRGVVEKDSMLDLAYVTGRDLRLAMKGIHEYRLPEPEILVCDVGTSVYKRTPSGFQRDLDYEHLMEEARGGLDVRQARFELERIPGLILQPEDRQTASKLSYHLPLEADHQAIVAAVQEALQGLGGSLQAVYSVGAPHGRGLLDLLPMGVAKDFAIHYLHDRTGIDPDHLVYAGDSGNDLAAMLSGFSVIVVGNATPGLREELTDRGGELGILDRLYFARERYVAGVMEGCRHFGLI